MTANRLPSRLLVLAAVTFVLWSGGAYAQTPAPTTQQAPALVRVFVDCNECDFEYLRQNVGFVDYVRDRNVADVHVLVTTQATGGGGRAWTVKFIGLGRFQNQERTIAFTTPSTATGDERRREFARIFKVGIVGYATDSPVLPKLDVTFAKADTDSTAQKTKDPWNYWVFNLGTGGNVDGEQVNKSRSFRGSVSASRTTEAWKVNVRANKHSDRSTFEIDEDTTIVSRQQSWNVNGLIVKSLGPKWSFGARGNVEHSSYSNTDRSVTAAPGIEFDYFPYSESARRSLTFQYTVGATRYDYRDVTIYDKLEETVPHHAVNVSLGLRQPWGDVGVSADITQHLNHTERFRSGVFGNAEVRVFKGLSFNIFANYSKIKDQIGLPKEAASTEEILLRIRQLQTNYRYFIGFEINYSFGSIFNTIVNPRFGGGHCC